MGLFDKNKSTSTNHQGVKPRWRMLKDLGDNARVWDISTGKKYVMGQLEPMFQSEKSDKVEDFGLKSTQFTDSDGRRCYGETVAASFLRLPEDYKKCSLVRM